MYEEFSFDGFDDINEKLELSREVLIGIYEDLEDKLLCDPNQTKLYMDTISWFLERGDHDRVLEEMISFREYLEAAL